jgi:hypothetical protein
VEKISDIHSGVPEKLGDSEEALDPRKYQITLPFVMVIHDEIVLA